MRPDVRRSLRAVLIVLAGAGLGSAACLAAEGPVEKKEAKAKVTFAPEVETKLVEFFTKLKEAKRKYAVERLQKQIEEVVKTTGLGPEGAKALEKPAQEAAVLSTESWLEKTEDLWRRQMNQNAEEILESLDQALPQMEMYAESDFFGGGESDPADHAVWTAALPRILTVEQHALWEKKQTERKQTLGKEFGDLVKRSVEGTRDRQLQLMMARTNDIKLNLGLSEERGKKLDALAKSATEQTADASQIRAEKMLLAMSEVQRRQVAKQGNLYLGMDEADGPERQAAWKDGLAQLLSPEEAKRLSGMQEQKKARRVRVLGRLLLALLDEHVAFTAAQRAQLEPIAERLAKGEPSFFPEAGVNDYFSFSPQSFLTAGGKATPKELESILDPIQRQHWQEAANAKVPSNRIRVAMRKPAPEPKPAPQDREPEPEQLEHVISDFLFEKAEMERKRVAGFMTLKAEDAARVSSLSAEAATRLRTAARGAAEEAIASWKSMTEEGLRSNLSEATPRNVKQRLEGMEDYQFRRGSSVVPEKRPVWEKTVGTEMTEPQRTAWQKEVNSRTEFREKAIASVILAEFDRKHLLTAAEWAKLEPMIATFMKDYGPDVAMMFSGSNSTPWFLQSYSMFLPFAGLPEKELKAILGKERWDRWVGSNEFSNTTHYWENVRGNHERRVKAPK